MDPMRRPVHGMPGTDLGKRRYSPGQAWGWVTGSEAIVPGRCVLDDGKARKGPGNDAQGTRASARLDGPGASRIARHPRVRRDIRVAGNSIEAGGLARRRATARREAYEARPSRGAIGGGPARLQALLAEGVAPGIDAAVRRHLEIEAGEAGVAVTVLRARDARDPRRLRAAPTPGAPR